MSKTEYTTTRDSEFIRQYKVSRDKLKKGDIVYFYGQPFIVRYLKGEQTSHCPINHTNYVICTNTQKQEAIYLASTDYLKKVTGGYDFIPKIYLDKHSISKPKN